VSAPYVGQCPHCGHVTINDAPCLPCDTRPNFHGHDERECDEHRTVGPHRAWCFDDAEWCYPDSPCRGCELPMLRAENDRLRKGMQP
jgi:hypothetical protein